MMSQNKGYTLLFAVLITALVISISVSVLNIARKEVILSSAARESFSAIYSADGALDCAVMNNQAGFFKKTGTDSTSWTQKNIICGGQDWLVKKIGNGNRNSSGNPFVLNFYTGLEGNQYSPCAKVEFRESATSVTIEARGYNVGWNSTAKDCSTPLPNKVERAFRYSYAK